MPYTWYTAVNTAWITGNIPSTDDFIRIENNELYLKEQHETFTAAVTTDFDQAQGFHSDLAAWYGNTKLGDDAQSAWADLRWNNVGAGTYSADVVNYKIGTQSAKCTGSADGNGIHIVKNVDFSTLGNGESSTTDDYVYIALYVEDVTKLATNGLLLRVPNDVLGTVTNYYYKAFLKASLVTGWNYLKTAKSAFSSAGAPSWANITGFSWEFNGAPSASTSFSCQLIQLVKKDPSSAVPNPLQRFGVRDFAINSGEWFVGLESGEIVCKLLAQTAAGYNMLLGTKAYTDFIASETSKCILAQYLYGPTWYIDSTNYIGVFVSGNTLSINVVEGGASTITSYPTSLSIVVGDVMEFTLIKSGANLLLIAYENGDRNTPYVVIATTALTSAGYLGQVGVSSTTRTFYIQSLSITTTDHAYTADYAESFKKATSSAPGIVELATNAETLTGTDTERAVTPANLKSVLAGNSGSIPYSDAMSASQTLTKNIPLGSSAYNRGMAVIQSSNVGILIFFDTVDTHSKVTGIYMSGSDLFGTAWSKNEVGFITNGAYGAECTGDVNIVINKCYIDGSNLRFDFENTYSASLSLSCDINWEVW